jgi:lipid-binding SYLF domain-containing protein
MKVTLATVLAVLILAGCSSNPPTTTEQAALQDKSASTLTIMKKLEPTLAPMVADAYGYAVFPSVGKGGLIAGGAHGRGTAYQKGVPVGTVDLTQATIGGQIGGQTYSELVVLQDQAAWERFKSGQLTLETGLSAVALDKSSHQPPKYNNGVVVFTHAEGGLMAEAVIGGQKFEFVQPTTQP